MTNQSVFFYVTAAIHPMFSANTSFMPAQPRVLRFSAYQLQINLYIIACMFFFDNDYRTSDLSRQDFVLDAKDIGYLTFTSMIGSIVLLPILSQTFSWLLQNELIITTSTVEIRKRCHCLRVTFIVICALTNVLTVLAAVWICQDTVSANQYLMGLSICGGFFSSFVFTNFLRIIFNIWAPEVLNFAKARKTREILKDLAVMQGLKSDKVTPEPGTPQINRAQTE